LVALLGLVVVAGCGYSRADYERMATGEQASQDRVRVAEAGVAELAALRGAMPWLDWRESALDHVCGPVEPGAMFVPSAGYLVCLTAVVQYAGFDGELAEEIGAFDAAVTAASWGPSTSHVSEPISYYQRFRGMPMGRRTYDASNVPAIVYPGGGDRLAVACGGSRPMWTLTQRWLEAGQPLPVAEQGEPAHRSGLEGPPVYQQLDPLDHQQAKTAALAKHRYLAVITLSAQCNYDPGG
jgi:hypothetical protein